MNTLHISPSAYIDGLTLPELQAELVLAASRLVGTRVVQSSISPQHVCRECAGRATERLAVLHTEACPVGMVAHLLLAIAHAEANLISPTHRKEPSKENSQNRPSRGAAQEKRPFVLPDANGWCWGGPGGTGGWRPIGATVSGQPWTGNDYGEPWTSSADGEVLDREGQLVVDPYGSGLVEPDDVRASHRMVACVNHCAGVPTEALLRETARATAGGGR
jgi:hypothetical protein